MMPDKNKHNGPGVAPEAGIDRVIELLKADKKVSVNRSFPDLPSREPVYSVSEADSGEDSARKTGSGLRWITLAAATMLLFLGGYLLVNRAGTDLYNDRIQAVSEVSEQSGRAIVAMASGDSYLIREGEQLNPFPGDVVLQGDIIRTEDGEIELVFSDRSMIRIQKNTELEMKSLGFDDSGERIALFQNSGRTISLFDNMKDEDRYDIVTPTTIAGVRGTVFSVTVDQGQTSIGVESGVVEVITIEGEGNRSPILVSAGELLSYFEGQSSAEQLGEADAADMDQDDLRHVLQNSNPEALRTAASMEVLATEEAIEEYYDRSIETIELRDGRLIRGIIASQVGNELIIHGAEGTRIVKMEDVMEVRYDF